MEFANFTLAIDGDGIALLTFDAPGRSMNTLTASASADLAAFAARLKSDPAILGAVITSGKASGFCAGADLAEMVAGTLTGPNAMALSDEAKTRALFEVVYGLNQSFRALETCGKPIAAAINGLALGGGFEICLACHYRVAAEDAPKLQLGLPEAKVGLIPGAGGTQRLPRLMGIMAALPMLLQGKSMSAAEAKASGLVHELAPGAELVARAKAWVKASPKAMAPWDVKGFKAPGGGVYTPGGLQTFVMGNAMLRKESYANYPAQLAIMSAVYEGMQVPIDTGLRIESRYFVKNFQTPNAKAMVRTLFLSMQELNKGSGRPKDAAASEVRKLGVLGAGMMGAGVAYVSAMAGIEVVLIDRDADAANKGKDYSRTLVEKAVARGKMSPADAEKLLARIHPDTDYAALAGADLVIEAVFENREIKADVTRRAEAVTGEASVFGSNTSTLPITGLAEASIRPENFIGVHFFSPVDKMQLVEIIRGTKTSDAALALALDYVLKIRKTPIVVNDSRGFYTSRVFGTYVSEGVEMLAEGIAPAIIDNVGRMTGMPRGPLELSDDVALDLAWKVRSQTKADLGDAYRESASDHVIDQMVNQHGRFGRKNGKGFYDYPADGGKKKLWRGLAELSPVRIAEADPDFVAELRTRFLLRQAVETARCFAEGVLTDVRDADVGAILAWGFAPQTGGPLSLIDSMGAAEFVRQCDRLAQLHGERFSPPQLLRDMAARNETFYERFAPVKVA